MLLVDAFNVIHASRDLAGVADLLARLASGRHAGRDITLVCDGDAGPRDAHEQALITRHLSGSRSRRILFAGPHREADDLLEDLLLDAPNPSLITVVSSDRRLRAAASRAGAASLDARSFLQDLDDDRLRHLSRHAPPRHTPTLDAGSVAWWINHFGLGTQPPTTPTSPIPTPAPPTARAKTPRPTTPIAPLRPLDFTLADEALSPDDLDMERWLRDHPPPRR